MYLTRKYNLSAISVFTRVLGNFEFEYQFLNQIGISFLFSFFSAYSSNRAVTDGVVRLMFLFKYFTLNFKRKKHQNLVLPHFSRIMHKKRLLVL